VTDRGEPPVALSIAGSDSGAGAGLQADLKTMGALGVFGTTAVTAVTAQNTVTVGAVQLLGADMVRSQIEAVLDDLPVAAVKTGMLGTAEVVEEVGRCAAAGRLPRLVVDPVMVASTGRLLLAEEGIDSYRRALLPHALVATPNLWEAAILAGVEPDALRDVDDMIEVARRLHKLGSRWVLVKGGHLPGVASQDGHPAPAQVPDVLFDGQAVSVLDGTHVDTPNTHGTGCSLSAAIAARLAHGDDVPAAVTAAKQFVHGALAGGAAWRLGAGHGPLDHLGWNRNGLGGVGLG
jgi:hydroxymethylpyrimidine/phosphomethylpyrimidine kinase